MQHRKIVYNSKSYAVIPVKYDGIKMPLVLNWKDFRAIKKLNKKWKYNENGLVSCHHTSNGVKKEVFIHELVMALNNRDNDLQNKRASIIHNNKIGLDNRRSNIMYDVQNKKHNRNSVKKKRTITLPKSSGVKVSEIPTYVWYMKPNGAHGERFMIDVGDVQWKTTSSKKLSLRYKLEEAKHYLRDLQDTRPDLFENYSMNGEFTKQGKKLLKEYYRIVEGAGYDHIDQVTRDGLTDMYLKEKKMRNKLEKSLIEDFNIGTKQRRRRCLNNLPEDCGVKVSDLPKYSYYRPAYRNRGDYFIVENHPDQECKTWQTTSKKSMSTLEKYNELMDYINNL